MDGWLYKTTYRWFKKAIEDYCLLKDGEKVLVAVSGGADSIALLHLFVQHNRRRNKNWELLLVHIRPNFPKWKTKPLEKSFKNLGLPYLIEDIDVLSKIELNNQPKNTSLSLYSQRSKLNTCFICSQERRKKLFEIAHQQGIQKIALAHHLEDVVETFFLNLFYTSKSSTLIPKQELFKGRINIIRPLYFFDQELIQSYLQSYGLKPVKNRCPYEKLSERERIRKVMNNFYSINKRIKTNTFWGIKNIKTKYLPD
jgi:tRNA 2-thiocytidine biosynthesis protein TtcA